MSSRRWNDRKILILLVQAPLFSIPSHRQTGIEPAPTQINIMMNKSLLKHAFLRLLLAGIPLILSTGCTSPPSRYVEEHEIKQLKVVFLDEHSLRERWIQVAGRDPIRFAAPMGSTTPIVKTVRGFYDYSSNTLYCEKWNFEVCGHELHHAALGQFHPQH